MLANLLNDSDNRAQFQASLSYRASPEYTEGLARRVHLDFPVYPLHYPEPSTAIPVPTRWPAGVRSAVRFASRQLTTYPLLVYEVWLLRRLFARLAPDVVHINNGGYPAALSARAAAIAAKLAGIRNVIMVVNNLAEERRGPFLNPRHAVDRKVRAAVAKFVTGSRAAAAQLQRVLGLADGHVVALANGVAVRAAAESREETLSRLSVNRSGGVILGVVALMEPRKGHRVLLEAIASLVRDGGVAHRFTVLLEGDGRLRAELEAFVERAAIQDYCRFIGVEANVFNFMSAIDILVLPSIAHEDFPNVILEAMGLGKPVIASKLAGTPEQVEDGVTGLLVPPGDAQSLAAAIARLAADAQLRAEMGRAGRRRFEERFTAKASVHRYMALYQSLLGTHPL
jgi:glycosyltransferase involved in cell wall biosynthesis